MDTFKSTSVAEKENKSVSGVPSSEDTVKYELYVKPDQAKLEQASKVIGQIYKTPCISVCILSCTGMYAKVPINKSIVCWSWMTVKCRYWR